MVIRKNHWGIGEIELWTGVVKTAETDDQQRIASTWKELTGNLFSSEGLLKELSKLYSQRHYKGIFSISLLYKA